MIASPTFSAWRTALHNSYAFDYAGLNALREHWSQEFGIALVTRMYEACVFYVEDAQKITEEVAAEHNPRLAKIEYEAREAHSREIGDAWSQLPAGAIREAARNVVVAHLDAMNAALQAQDDNEVLSTWYAEYQALQAVLIDAAGEFDLAAGTPFASKTQTTKRFMRDLGRIAEVDEVTVSESAGSTTEAHRTHRFVYRDDKSDVVTGAADEEVIDRTVHLDFEDDEEDDEEDDGSPWSTTDEILNVALARLLDSLTNQVNALYAAGAPAVVATPVPPHAEVEKERREKRAKKAKATVDQLVNAQGRWKRAWEQPRSTWTRKWQGGL